MIFLDLLKKLGTSMLRLGFDNFDLKLNTVNGQKHTHQMATQLLIHPAGIIESGSNSTRATSPFLSLTIQLPAFHSFPTKAAAEQNLIEERMPPTLTFLTFASSCVKTFVNCR